MEPVWTAAAALPLIFSPIHDSPLELNLHSVHLRYQIRPVFSLDRGVFLSSILLSQARIICRRFPLSLDTTRWVWRSVTNQVPSLSIKDLRNQLLLVLTSSSFSFHFLFVAYFCLTLFESWSNMFYYQYSSRLPFSRWPSKEAKESRVSKGRVSSAVTTALPTWIAADGQTNSNDELGATKTWKWNQMKRTAWNGCDEIQDEEGYEPENILAAWWQRCCKRFRSSAQQGLGAQYEGNQKCNVKLKGRCEKCPAGQQTGQRINRGEKKWLLFFSP